MMSCTCRGCSTSSCTRSWFLLVLYGSLTHRDAGKRSIEADVRRWVEVECMFDVLVGGGWKQICLQSRRRRRHRSLSMLARSSSQCDNSKVNKSNDWLLSPEVKTASAPVTSTTSFPFILLSLTSFYVSCGFKMFSTAIDLATAHSRHVCCTLLDASQNLKSYFCKLA